MECAPNGTLFGDGVCAVIKKELLEEFRLRRTSLVRSLMDLDPEALRHSAQHPCRGMHMRPVDMAIYLAEHDDHHLALIRGLLDGRRLAAGN